VRLRKESSGGQRPSEEVPTQIAFGKDAVSCLLMRKIAFVGHAIMQAPSPRQFSGLTTLASPSLISSTLGPSFLHSTAQCPQPRHRVGCISGILPFTNVRPNASETLASIFSSATASSLPSSVPSLGRAQSCPRGGRGNGENVRPQRVRASTTRDTTPTAQGWRNFETKGDSPTTRRRKCPEGPRARNSANHASCSISSLRIASANSYVRWSFPAVMLQILV